MPAAESATDHAVVISCKDVPPVPKIPLIPQNDTQQECGPACAQMIITQSAATGGGPQLLPDQGSLFVFISGNNDPDVQMYTSPGGLSRALNQFIPPAGALKYAPLQTLGDPDMICRRIVWAILTTKQASCVLINDAAHWVVVSGCSVSKIPTNPDDDFEICSLTVLNPLPNTDPQGSTPFSLWKSEYMTAVPNSLGGIQYGGTFVAVAPAAVPPLQTLPAAGPDGSRVSPTSGLARCVSRTGASCPASRSSHRSRGASGTGRDSVRASRRTQRASSHRGGETSGKDMDHHTSIRRGC
jgi:hypothetical protein